MVKLQVLCKILLPKKVAIVYPQMPGLAQVQIHIHKYLLLILSTHISPLCSEDTKTGHTYYFNFRTNESTWDHPCDEFYRKLLMEERKKRNREGGSKKAPKKSSKAKKTAGNEVYKCGVPSHCMDVYWYHTYLYT